MGVREILAQVREEERLLGQRRERERKWERFLNACNYVAFYGGLLLFGLLILALLKGD